MDSRQNGLWSSHLSDASVRQRSLPPPGAVLDIAGGGEGEEPQDAQGEHGVRHGCCWWSVGWALRTGAVSSAWVDVRLTDNSVGASLIRHGPDKSHRHTGDWRQWRAILLPIRTRVRGAPASAEVAGRCVSAWDVCHHTDVHKTTAEHK